MRRSIFDTLLKKLNLAAYRCRNCQRRFHQKPSGKGKRVRIEQVYERELALRAHVIC